MTVRRNLPYLMLKKRRASSTRLLRRGRLPSLFSRWAGMEDKTSSCLSSRFTIWLTRTRHSGRMEGAGGASSWREVWEVLVLLYSSTNINISADYCPETPDNIELVISKMKLRRVLKRLNIPYQIMGDLKMMNILTGIIFYFGIRTFCWICSYIFFFIESER